MERHDMTELDARLRAARPHAAVVDDHAFDGDLLARVRQGPIAARRRVPRAVVVPVAGGVTLVAVAAVMLVGPGEVGGPSSAAAITQTLRWLDPPSGTVLHVRSVETSGGRTTTRELWQSADRPSVERQLVVAGATRYETAGGMLYDPATDTIYDAPAGSSAARASKLALAGADAAKAARLRADGKTTADQVAGGSDDEKPAAASADAPKRAPADRLAGTSDDELPHGDPIVQKVRMLLQDGRMRVTGRELRNGTEAWAITLVPDAGRPSWTLWVAVADGRPLEVRDPGRDASVPPQVIRWPTYEVLPGGARSDRLLTLAGAHPTARVVHDPAQTAAAQQRLLPAKG